MKTGLTLLGLCLLFSGMLRAEAPFPSGILTFDLANDKITQSLRNWYQTELLKHRSVLILENRASFVESSDPSAPEFQMSYVANQIGNRMEEEVQYFVNGQPRGRLRIVRSGTGIKPLGRDELFAFNIHRSGDEGTYFANFVLPSGTQVFRLRRDQNQNRVRSEVFLMDTGIRIVISEKSDASQTRLAWRTFSTENYQSAEIAVLVQKDKSGAWNTRYRVSYQTDDITPEHFFSLSNSEGFWGILFSLGPQMLNIIRSSCSWPGPHA